MAGIKGLDALQFSGGVRGLEIDVGLLAAGEFPITGIESFSIGVTGKLAGGEVEGVLIAGIVKLDAQSNIINTVLTPNAVVARNVFYVGLSGSLNIPGVGGVEMRVAFSEFGPLSFFISSGVPIILDPQSGLAITDLAGGVDFGGTIEDPTVFEVGSVTNVDAQKSAYKLRSVATSTNPSTVTATQWENQLRQQIANIVKNAGGRGHRLRGHVEEHGHSRPCNAL